MSVARIPWEALKPDAFADHADDVTLIYADKFQSDAESELFWLRGVIGSNVLKGATRAVMARALRLAALEVESMQWMTEARRLIGTREVPGGASNPVIMAWGNRLGARVLGIAYGADSVPWCGLFAAWCIQHAGITPPKIAIRAKAWATWGTPLPLSGTPPMGAIAVFGRDGGGHVGFVNSVNADGSINVLGGNQGDAVNVRRFSRDRLVALRWPAGQPVGAPAHIAHTAAAKTTGEA